jgi:ankyrin repeat protein
MHAAAFSGSLAAARQLLNVGGSAIIFAASNDGKSPLVLAAEQKKASMVKV